MNRMSTPLDGRGLRLAVVASRFNESIVSVAMEACVQRLRERRVAAEAIDLIEVPGALEIPLALQVLAKREREGRPVYDALIALGAVIRGATYHFEVVCNESARGILDVSLHTGIAIANGVLTCNSEEQAFARAAIKGGECADVAIEMARLVKSLA